MQAIHFNQKILLRISHFKRNFKNLKNRDKQKENKKNFKKI